MTFAADCPKGLIHVASTSRPQPAAKFEGISGNMSMPDIIKRLGPAARDIGSGVYVLEWDVADGRVFSVSSGTLCGQPAAARFFDVPRRGLR